MRGKKKFGKLPEMRSRDNSLRLSFEDDGDDLDEEKMRLSVSQGFLQGLKGMSQVSDINKVFSDETDDDKGEEVKGISMLSEQSTDEDLGIDDDEMWKKEEEISKLKRELSSKEKEINRLKRTINEQNREFEEGKEEIRHQEELKRNEILRKYQAEKNIFNEWQNKIKTEIMGFKKKMKEVEKERPSYLNNLQRVKEDLGNLAVTSDRYLELKKKPEEELNLKSYVQLKVYEIVHKFKRKNEDNERMLDNLALRNEDLETTKIEFDKKLSEVERKLKLKEHRIRELESDNYELSERISQFKENFDEYRSKSKKINLIDDKAKRYERESSELRERVECYDTAVEKIADLVRTFEDFEISVK